MTLDAYALDLRDARAEIARLTDVGATFSDAVALVERWRDKWAETYADRNDEFAGTERVAAETILRDLKTLAAEKQLPPPPAAADRGVPGQRVSDARLLELDAYAKSAEREEEWGKSALSLPQAHRHLAWIIDELRQTRAALATAPKAEDVRRAGCDEKDVEIAWLKDENASLQRIDASRYEVQSKQQVALLAALSDKDRAEAETTRLRAVVKKLRDGLKPLAEENARWADHWPDDECVDEAGFCLSMLRTASRLLAETAPDVPADNEGANHA